VSIRPALLRILGKSYSVSYRKGGPLGDDEQGDCNYQKQEITVMDGLGGDEERATLLHEAIHCVAYAMGINLPEKHVEALEGGLYALMVDNPDLMNYLLRRQDA